MSTALPRRSLMSGTGWCALHLLLGILASAGQQSASWAVSEPANIHSGVYRSASRGLQPGLPACRDQEEDLDVVVCSGQHCYLSLQLKDHPPTPRPSPFRGGVSDLRVFVPGEWGRGDLVLTSLHPPPCREPNMQVLLKFSQIHIAK